MTDSDGADRDPRKPSPVAERILKAAEAAKAATATIAHGDSLGPIDRRRAECPANRARDSLVSPAFGRPGCPKRPCARPESSGGLSKGGDMASSRNPQQALQLVRVDQTV
jgi:hypothetical protein